MQSYKFLRYFTEHPMKWLREVDSGKYLKQSSDKTAMFSNAVKSFIKMHINYARFEISIKSYNLFISIGYFTSYVSPNKFLFTFHRRRGSTT